MLARKLVNTSRMPGVSLPVGHDFVGHGLQRVEAGIAAIFDHHFETAGGAEAFQRRSAEHVDHAIGDFILQPGLQGGGDRFGR